MSNEQKPSTDIPAPEVKFLPPSAIEFKDDVPGEEASDDMFDEDYYAGYMDGKDETESVYDNVKNNSVEHKREDTRGRLAIIYTLATFVVFLVVIAIAVFDGVVRKVSIIDNLKDVIPVISGVFLGTLGFVLGYYFKNGEDR